MFLPSHSLDTVSPSDMLFCFEVLSKDMAKERVVLLRVQQVIKTQIFAFLKHVKYVCLLILRGLSVPFVLPYRDCRFLISPSPSVQPV